MDAFEVQGRLIAATADVERRTAVFVGMSGGFAQVNVGNRTITVPCVGFTPPVPGMAVQLERRGRQYAVLGPAVPLNPIGSVTGTGSPKCQVTVDGVPYQLLYRSSYTPVIGDLVEVNWTTGVVQGAISGVPTTTPLDSNPTPATADLPTDPVLASDSGQFRNVWQSNTVRASTSVSGAWFYNGRVASALAGASVTGLDIFLSPSGPSLGVCFIGTHGFGTKPGGWTGIANQVSLDSRAGWVSLPTSFVAALQGGGGIAVTSGNGDNQWYGTQGDRLSGALRFRGTR